MLKIIRCGGWRHRGCDTVNRYLHTSLFQSYCVLLKDGLKIYAQSTQTLLEDKVNLTP